MVCWDTILVALIRADASKEDDKDMMEAIKQDLTEEQFQQLESMCKGPGAGMSLTHTGGSVRRRVCLVQCEPSEGLRGGS